MHIIESRTAMILKILFLPGNLVLKWIGLSVEEDSGIMRSFINASFWGILSLAIILRYFV
jgi:hypothetical protein